MIANIDNVGMEAVCGGQATVTATAAAAAVSISAPPPPGAVADVPAASATPRPRHAAAAEQPSVAFVGPALAASHAGLSGSEELHQNVAVSLGARPVERGKLAVWRFQGQRDTTPTGVKGGIERGHMRGHRGHRVCRLFESDTTI